MQEEQILQGLPNQIFAGVANIAGFTNNKIFADPNVCRGSRASWKHG